MSRRNAFAVQPTMSRPCIEVIRQGKTVIQADGEGYLIMHPDGDVVGASTREKAARKARAWYRTALRGKSMAMSIGEIEWRE